jgi:hypothetical protein
MRWSVVVEARGDRVVTLDEVVELADAVAGAGGVASGVGTSTYAARIVVEAGTGDAAAKLALSEFVAAASRAGLPGWPASVVDLVSDAPQDQELPG